jgi:hypothetical protein
MQQPVELFSLAELTPDVRVIPGAPFSRPVVKLAAAAGSKSAVLVTCRFESDRAYQFSVLHSFWLHATMVLRYVVRNPNAFSDARQSTDWSGYARGFGVSETTGLTSFQAPA